MVLESAAVRLNSRLELTTRWLKVVVGAAVQRCDGEFMTQEHQYRCVVRDHLIPSLTLASRPAGNGGQKTKRDDGVSAPVGEKSGGSDTSSSEFD